ncbi:MAG TPA: FecR domain-containing protein [Devosiaceae bacterium]|nr:FecR domain-containing protein [Devosiaceae bacterium]
MKLRGIVLGLFGSEWVKLERGAVIPDDQPIRTLRSGRVTFQRGAESIDLGPDTQVQIIDRTGYAKYTTVKQYFGRVEVEAEVREVTHFAVQTPFLAAVVKGTRFVVISGDRGAKVQVERGAVAVEDSDDHSSVVVTAGQEVSATPEAVMQVSGRGDLPQVVDAGGRLIDQQAAAPGSAQAGAAPGKSGSAPGKSGSAPGKSGSAPGHSGGGSRKQR